MSTTFFTVDDRKEYIDAAYAYDTEGHRVSATVNGTETRYVWDTLSPYGDVVVETDETNTVQTSYALANGRLLAQTQSDTTSYYLPDVQGSVRLLTDSGGAVTDVYSYTPFGEPTQEVGSTANAYLYTGQQYDDHSGLYSLRARFYDPGVGRFLRADTYPLNYLNPIEFNRYVYAANNPVNFSDPSGYGIFSYANIKQKVSQVGSISFRRFGRSVIEGGIADGAGYLLGCDVKAS